DLRGFMLDRIEPVRVRAPLFQQPVARAELAFQGVDAARMCAIDCKHQPVEKTPSLSRRSAEQSIHRGSHPNHAEMICKCRSRGNGLAIDAAFARERRV